MGKSSMYGYEMILYLILTICPCIVLKTRFLMKKQGKYLVLSNFTSNFTWYINDLHMYDYFIILKLWFYRLLTNIRYFYWPFTHVITDSNTNHDYCQQQLSFCDCEKWNFIFISFFTSLRLVVSSDRIRCVNCACNLCFLETQNHDLHFTILIIFEKR